jgi:cytochrome c heme-lyase
MTSHLTPDPGSNWSKLNIFKMSCRDIHNPPQITTQSIVMSSRNASDPADACPVDHKAREAWLQQAKAQNAAATTPQSPHTSAPAPAPLESSTCDSSQMDQAPASTTKTPASAPTASGILGSIRGLGTQREVSTIPRTVSTEPAAADQRPANNERDTGADKKTGNWIYPSEQMFFDAMKRKAYNPEQADMRTIVPIHNAVNERAWKEIKEWERGRGSEGYVCLSKQNLYTLT